MTDQKTTAGGYVISDIDRTNPITQKKLMNGMTGLFLRWQKEPLD